MADFLIRFQNWQVAAVAIVFLIVAGVEALAPLTGNRRGLGRPWLMSLALFAFGTGLVLVSAKAIFAGAQAVQQALSFPSLVSLGLPVPVLIVVSLLIIDLVAYLSHAAFHAVPWLWRLHRTHHADTAFDASTGVRHHPIEALLGAIIQVTIFAVLGIPLLVVLAYGVISTVWQFVTHADVRLPEVVDRSMRLLLVTPGMHRVHHSIRLDEGNSNFGMVLSVWDRLFGTYRRRPAEERASMPVGVEGFAPGGSVLAGLGEPLRSARSG